MIARANRHSGWRTRSGREGLGAAKAATAMRLFMMAPFLLRMIVRFCGIIECCETSDTAGIRALLELVPIHMLLKLFGKSRYCAVHTRARL